VDEDQHRRPRRVRRCRLRAQQPAVIAAAVDAVVDAVVSVDSGDIERRSGGAMTTRGEWARSRRCCSGIARSAP